MKYAKAIDALDLLQRYYARQLVQVAPNQWRALEEYADTDFALDYPEVASAFKGIYEANPEEADGFKYDFNRLFVGPDALLAPPFATLYLSEEKTLMRGVTLSVREEYARFGMQVDAKNVEPDDHFAYELRFMWLLASSDDPKAEAALERFLERHVSRWVGPHVKAVRANTENSICLGFADLLWSTISAMNQIAGLSPEATAEATAE